MATLINDNRLEELSRSNFNIDKVLGNPNCLVSFTGGSIALKATMIDDFGFSFGSEYNSLFDVGSIDDLAGGLNRATAVINNFANLNIPQVRLKTPGLTSKAFIGSKNPSFDIKLIIMNVHEGDDIMTKVKNFVRMSMPSIDSFTKLGGLYVAPMGYRTKTGATRSTGPISVRIGKWFYAPNQIIEDVSVHFSKVSSNSSGQPLYATLSVRFGPTLDIGVSELLSYITPPSK